MPQKWSLDSLIAHAIRTTHVSRGHIWSCLEWQGQRDKDGYARCKYHGRSWRVSRLVWTLTYGQEPTHWALHHCDNPPCIDITHLYDGTHQQNVDDAITAGRHTCQRQDLIEKRLATLRSHEFRAKHRTSILQSKSCQAVWANPQHGRRISQAIRRITLPEVARMIQLRTQGLTYQAISDQMGYSTHGIHRAIQLYAKELRAEEL